MLCVLNAVPPRGPREGQARALLADFGVPVAAPRLGQRAAVDYTAAVGALAGLTPARPESRDGAFD